jgi:tetratricopeptide (TPR) repeat protein
MSFLRHSLFGEVITTMMSTLNTVRSIVRKMSNEERKVAKSFLTAFSPRGTNAPNQALKLFELLCDELEEKTPLKDSDVRGLVYSEKSDVAFPRLILRLKEKLIESLLLSVNLERVDTYSERGRALHEIRKGISQAQILHARGSWHVALPLLDDCVKKAARYEHYEEWASALRIRMEIRTIERGRNYFESDNTIYEKVIRGIVASKRALEHYHKLVSRIGFKAETSHLEEIQHSIDILQLEFERTGSANVAFFLHYLEIQFYQDVRLYKSASRILKRLCDLVENSPAVTSPDRLMGVYINCAWNEICIRKFSGALKYLTKAKGVSKTKNFNYYQCIETEFYALYYNGDYSGALKRIDELMDAEMGGEFRAGKRQYQKACVLFMLGRYDQVQKELTILNPIEEDHEGWNLALRTLFIMNDVELEKTENANKRNDNMRKHIAKLKKANKNRPREILKFEILRTLYNCKFDFVQTRGRSQIELQQLSSTQEKYQWQIMSPELVIFDQWFDSKVFKQKLNLIIPPYIPPVLSRQELSLEEKIKNG